MARGGSGWAGGIGGDFRIGAAVRQWLSARWARLNEFSRATRFLGLGGQRLRERRMSKMIHSPVTPAMRNPTPPMTG